MHKNSQPEYFLNSKAVRLFQRQRELADLPKVVVSDLDGTLFTPDLRIVAEIFHHNRQLKKILARKLMPLIINTARSRWAARSIIHCALLGIHPDIVITGAGTQIEYLSTDTKLVKDQQWENYLLDSHFSASGHNMKWSDPAVYQKIHTVVENWLVANKHALLLKHDFPFQVRYVLKNQDSSGFPTIAESLQQNFDHGVRVVYAESVYSNMFGFPTGEIIIIPSAAGKDNALKFLLKRFSSLVDEQIEALCFGDGTIDLNSFLTMDSSPEYSLRQFLVHPTKLAKNIYSHLNRDSKPALLKKSGSEALVRELNAKLSPIQNSRLRKYFTEPANFFLDKIYPSNLSANEITLLGLTKVLDATDGIYQKKMNPAKAVSIYSYGLFADIADGIRARHTFTTKKGQLADDFADRVREFYQLYIRGIRRLKSTDQALITFQTAISCILTGISRRQAELSGHFFPEGPTFDRTKKLFFSIFYDGILGLQSKSFSIDSQILKESTEVFNKRMIGLNNLDISKLLKNPPDTFDVKTFERWLLYIQLLQEEDVLIKEVLSENFHKKYQDWIISLKLNSYINEIDVKKIREEFGLKDYGFSLNNYSLYFEKWHNS